MLVVVETAASRGDGGFDLGFFFFLVGLCQSLACGCFYKEESMDWWKKRAVKKFANFIESERGTEVLQI